MLFLLIVALIATPAFYKRSRAMGTASGRLASVPFMVLAGFLAVDYVARLAVSWTTAAAGVSLGVASGILFALDLFVILAYVAVIRAFWVAFDRVAK